MAKMGHMVDGEGDIWHHHLHFQGDDVDDDGRHHHHQRRFRPRLQGIIGESG